MIETRSLPRSLAATRRGFTFYVGNPISSIETRSLPTLTHVLPWRLYVDHSPCPVLAPATLAALPSTRAIPDRDVFYVTPPGRSILTSYFETRPAEKASHAYFLDVLLGCQLVWEDAS